jgi:hypothetical protein
MNKNNCIKKTRGHQATTANEETAKKDPGGNFRFFQQRSTIMFYL